MKNAAVSTTLGALMVKRAGSVDPSKYSAEEFDLYSIPAYDRGAPDVALGRDIGSSKQIVQPGDVLLSRIVPHIRRAWVVGPCQGRRLIASGEWIVFRSEEVQPEWLRQFLLTDGFHVRFMQTVAGVGGSLLRARPAQVANLSLGVPEIVEQRRIAAILNLADSLVTRHHRIADDVREAEQALFLDAFGGIETEELGDKLSFVTSGGRGWAKYYSDEGSPFIRSLDVQMGSISSKDLAYVGAPDNAEARRTRTKSGDVLLTITGSRIGRSSVLPQTLEGAYISQHVAILRPDTQQVVPGYLAAFLCSPRMGQVQIRAAQYGQTKPGLNFDQIKRFRIPQADLSCQKEFCSKVAAIRDLAASADRANRMLGTLSASLQSRAFSGRL